MNSVIYRDLVKADYEDIKNLIDEAFEFNKWIEDKSFLNTMLDLYLQSCILDSSFAKVAEKNNAVIGIILGSAKKDKKRLRKFHNILNSCCSVFKLLFTRKQNKKAIKSFLEIDKTYKELISGKKDEFQGCVQLFIMSEKYRGLGVGKKLLGQLFNYMNDMEVNSLYLYTDNRCNYGFYDSQGFKRVSEKEITFDIFKANLDVFLYSYDFV